MISFMESTNSNPNIMYRFIEMPMYSIGLKRYFELPNGKWSS